MLMITDEEVFRRVGEKKRTTAEPSTQESNNLALNKNNLIEKIMRERWLMQEATDGIMVGTSELGRKHTGRVNFRERSTPNRRLKVLLYSCSFRVWRSATP